MPAQDEPPEREIPAAGPRRAPRGELISAAAAIALLVIMFATAWFGVDGIPGRSALVSAENAWHGLTVVRWLMLLTIVVSIGSPIIHATQRTHGSQTETSGVITVLGTLTALILTYRVLIHLPSPNAVVDQKLCAYFGVLCAWAIALGGYDALRETAARRGALRHRQAAEHMAGPPAG